MNLFAGPAAFLLARQPFRRLHRIEWSLPLSRSVCFHSPPSWNSTGFYCQDHQRRFLLSGSGLLFESVFLSQIDHHTFRFARLDADGDTTLVRDFISSGRSQSDLKVDRANRGWPVVAGITTESKPNSFEPSTDVMTTGD